MPTLMECIEKFADTRRVAGSGSRNYVLNGLDTPEGAYCMCDSTSDAFIRFAQAAGYTGKLARYDFTLYSSRNPDPSLYQCGQHPRATFERADWHAIVETEEFLLDFTAKQYHHEACYPHIISRAVAGIPKFGETFAAAAAAGGK